MMNTGGLFAVTWNLLYFCSDCKVGTQNTLVFCAFGIVGRMHFITSRKNGLREHSLFQVATTLKILLY